VPRLDARVREAAQMGFARVGFPASQQADAEGARIERVPLTTLREACELLLGDKVAPLRPESASPDTRLPRPAEQAPRS